MTKAKMPWDGDIAHTKLSDGRVVLRGSPEEAEHILTHHLVDGNNSDA